MLVVLIVTGVWVLLTLAAVALHHRGRQHRDGQR